MNFDSAGICIALSHLYQVILSHLSLTNNLSFSFVLFILHAAVFLYISGGFRHQWSA